MQRLLFLALFLPFLAGAQDGHKIEMKIDGLEADTAYMANYLGTKLYYYDTAYAEKPDKLVFSGEDSVKPGMYSLVVEGQKFFDFIVDEQEFQLRTKKGSPVESMKAKNSPNNELFYNYIRRIQKEKKEAQPLRAQAKKAEGKEKERLQEKLDRIDERVKEYQSKLIEENEELLASKIVKATLEVDVPEPPDSLEGKEKQRYQHNYYKKHYFDNVELEDERLARTPMLGRKVKQYFNKFIVENPDSAIKAADRVLSRVEEGTDMYKYIVNFITNKYMNSDIMGMDAVFVHMAKNYYFDGKADWPSEGQLKDWKERVKKVEPLLIGKQAPIISLADSTGENFISLGQVDAKYTILYFWDPDCGHCKKATPKLKKAYDTLKARGVEVYAVGTPLKNGDWKEYIRKHDLNWINVSDNPHINNNPREYLGRTDLKSMNFRDTYDIYSTPRIFLLDEDKTIIAKELGIDQVVEYIDRLLKDEEPQSSPSIRDDAQGGAQR